MRSPEQTGHERCGEDAAPGILYPERCEIDKERRYRALCIVLVVLLNAAQCGYAANTGEVTVGLVIRPFAQVGILRSYSAIIPTPHKPFLRTMWLDGNSGIAVSVRTNVPDEAALKLSYASLPIAEAAPRAVLVQWSETGDDLKASPLFIVTLVSR